MKPFCIYGLFCDQLSYTVVVTLCHPFGRCLRFVHRLLSFFLDSTYIVVVPLVTPNFHIVDSASDP